MGNILSREIIAICQGSLPLHYNDCSGFVRDVASQCGIFLLGNANEIITYASKAWVSPSVDATQLEKAFWARDKAQNGFLVVAGVEAAGHGHVVVVIDGPLSRNAYPHAFWGQYHGLTVLGEIVNVGFTRGHGGINWSFGEKARERLLYAACETIPSFTHDAASKYELDTGHILYW